MGSCFCKCKMTLSIYCVFFPGLKHHSREFRKPGAGGFHWQWLMAQTLLGWWLPYSSLSECHWGIYVWSTLVEYNGDSRQDTCVLDSYKRVLRLWIMSFPFWAGVFSFAKCGGLDIWTKYACLSIFCVLGAKIIVIITCMVCVPLDVRILEMSNKEEWDNSGV